LSAHVDYKIAKKLVGPSYNKGMRFSKMKNFTHFMYNLRANTLVVELEYLTQLVIITAIKNF